MRGVPRHQAKVSILVQRDRRPVGRQDGGHHGAQRRRHHQSLLQAKTTFGRIACTSCPLSNCPPLLPPFLLNIWGEDQGLYK